MSFAERLKKLKNEKNITNKELAQSLKVGANLISSWEKNETEPTGSQLISLAKFFQVSADYLLGMKENTDKSPTSSNPLESMINPFFNLNNEDDVDLDEQLISELVQVTKAIDLRK